MNEMVSVIIMLSLLLIALSGIVLLTNYIFYRKRYNKQTFTNRVALVGIVFGLSVSIVFYTMQDTLF